MVICYFIIKYMSKCDNNKKNVKKYHRYTTVTILDGV